MQILFSGSTRMMERFQDPVLAPIADQIKHWIQLAYLNAEEVEPFINHCLNKSGYRGKNLFSPDAIESLIRHSAGNPRLIMNLCGFSLLSASIENTEQITRAMIDEVAIDCIFETIAERSDGNTDGPTGSGSSNLIPLIPKAKNVLVQNGSNHQNAYIHPLRSDAVRLRCRELGIPHPDIENS